MSTTLRAGFAVLALAGLALSGTAAVAHDIDGEATVAGVGPVAHREAVSAAIADWKREVYAHYGYYARWKTAAKKDIDCDTHRNGTTECEVEAIPTR
jgi:hypothetical protein